MKQERVIINHLLRSGIKVCVFPSLIRNRIHLNPITELLIAVPIKPAKTKSGEVFPTHNLQDASFNQNHIIVIRFPVGIDQSSDVLPLSPLPSINQGLVFW
jgi:hypothetical protein